MLWCNDAHYTVSSHVSSTWTNFHLASLILQRLLFFFLFFFQRTQLCICTLDKGQVVDPSAKRKELSVTQIFTLAACIMDLALETLGGKRNGTRFSVFFFFSFSCSVSFPVVPKCRLSLLLFLLCNCGKVKHKS